MTGDELDALAQRVAELEGPMLRQRAQTQKRSDWIKIIFGSLVTVSLIMAATMMDIGGYRENFKTLDALVHQHVDKYTPEKQSQINDMDKRISVNSSQIGSIEIQLKRIEDKQDEIYRLLLKAGR